MNPRTPSPALTFLFSTLAIGLLSGCSGSFAPSSIQPHETPIGNIQGSVHGGQAPVTGAHIYLYAASTAGYGTNATSLISSTASNATADGNGNYYVTTDSNGNFALGGDYTCTQGQQVYMVAVGGNPGLTGTVNNTAIVQMAGLGQCPAAGNLAAQVPYLVINEVTTVAFAYAMSGFATTAYNVSTDATGTAAIANAMANTSNIVNLQWGQAPAIANGNPNSINPQAKLYALANIAAACVNTSSAASSACSNLFSVAKSAAGAVATDEANALFNIAHNQAANVSSIWNLTPSIPVFTPTLTNQPTDWTMPVIYAGLVSQPGTNGSNQIVSGPFNIAFDANGNAWIGDRQKGVVEVGPQGASTTINNGFGMVKGVAVSPVNGTIWVSDYGNNTLDVMDTTGTILSAITTDINGNGPILTAFSGNISGRALAFQANETTTGVVVFDSATYALQDFETGASFANIQTPGWISVDNTGNAWIPSTNTTWIGELTFKEKGKSGNFTYTPSETNGSPNSYSTVGDSNGDIWLASITGAPQLEEISSGNTSVSSTWSGGGMNGPFKLAVDGSNNIWISNANANTVSGFNTSGNGSWLATNGFSTSAQGGAGCVVAAPDPSGNLWAANSDGSVTQLLGLATPTAAPMYGGVKSTGSNSTPGNLGTKP
jgi:hypothetical protein